MAIISSDNFIRILTEQEMESVLNGALSILEDPGFQFNSPAILEALKKNGAAVDTAKFVARLPRKLVMEAADMAAAEEKARIDSIISGSPDEYTKLNNSQNDCPLPFNYSANSLKSFNHPANSLTFSWHSAHVSRSPALAVSMGGGCPQYLDYEKNEKRDATYHDYLRMVRLGEALNEVKTVGNPLHMVVGEDSGRVDPRMMAIKGAALIAKNTSKPGLSTILHPSQLEYLIEIGVVVKGSYEEYRKNPIFININDTETPLSINSHECDIIEALAKKGLPVMIIPMPLTGINVPVTLASAVMLGVAEILAAWAAVKAINPDAPVEAGIITGAMDARTGAASFSTPECIMQDIAAAQIMRHRLKTRCSVGVGFNDASYPGAASAMHRSFKMMAAAACGEVNFPIGILNAGVVFSPEQAMIDLELACATERFFSGIDVSEEKLAVDLIRQMGPGSMFIDQEHTAEHMREELWVPDIFTKSKQGELREEMRRDMVVLAHEKWKNILAKSEPYHIEENKSKEIDRIVAEAEKKLTGSL